MATSPASRLYPFLHMRRPILALWGFFIVLAVTGSIDPSLAPGGAHHIDKLVHFSVYALLGAFLPLLSRRFPIQLAGALFLVVLGGGIEILQAFLPMREGSFFDFAADLVGAGLGWGVVRCCLVPLMPRRA